MKVFISADIEGVSGTTTWSEASKSSAGYREFQRQMTREVTAACEGALAAGATDILIKDAHGDAGNLLHADLPRQARLVRGWSGHPFAMVQELDDSFAAVMMVGYHARAGADGNPLAHTLSSRQVHRIFLNDRPASEFYFHYLAAGLVGVPVIMLTGDATICHEVNETDAAILTAAVRDASGASTINLHPDAACDLVRETAGAAMRARSEIAAATPPEGATLRIVFKEQQQAYYKSWYPGATLEEPYTVSFTATDYFDILRALIFLV